MTCRNCLDVGFVAVAAGVYVDEGPAGDPPERFIEYEPCECLTPGRRPPGPVSCETPTVVALRGDHEMSVIQGTPLSRRSEPEPELPADVEREIETAMFEAVRAAWPRPRDRAPMGPRALSVAGTVVQAAPDYDDPGLVRFAAEVLEAAGALCYRMAVAEQRRLAAEGRPTGPSVDAMLECRDSLVEQGKILSMRGLPGVEPA